MNTIYHQDCIIGMRDLSDESVDCILTDPPYKYLKNQKLEVDFDETEFFDQAKRVLKKNGFIVLFGRGTSFYRWNTMLADLGFAFKEEIVWDKSYCTSPLMAISRVHETVSIHTKGKGVINRVKVPYLEMKRHDLGGVVQDINRMKSILKNTKSLDAVLAYLENNMRDTSDAWHSNDVSISSDITKENRSVSCMRSIKQGLNEKTIIRTDMNSKPTTKYNSSTRGEYSDADRSTNVLNSVVQGMNEKTIIRTDQSERDDHNHIVTTRLGMRDGERSTNVLNSVVQGMNEKTIIKQAREHYATIHPTQKPVRLLERLLALVTKQGDLVLDPFSGSGATAIACINTSRKYVGYEIDEGYYNAAANRIVAFRSKPKQLGIFDELQTNSFIQ